MNVYDDGYLRVEFDYFYVACRGAPIYALARQEFLIFAGLLRASGRSVARQTIWQEVWQGAELNDPALRERINTLRRKLKPSCNRKRFDIRLPSVAPDCAVRFQNAAFVQ
ncbi:MAG: helix-turn-helix domain-containing protein [Blastocatellia bacterium]